MLPEHFVYLHEIDSTIQSNLRYYSNHNFTNTRIDGYQSDKHVVLTLPTALALRQIQSEVRSLGYSLVVYDAYRPQKAVNHFYRWSQEPDDQSTRTKDMYYPRHPKEELFALDYIALQSSHSRGSTVDLTLISLDKQLLPEPILTFRTSETNPNFAIPYLDDNTIDMGSSFDLFDEISHHDLTSSNYITSEQLNNRNLLRDIMMKHGFEPYSNEWWHYHYIDEPYPDTFFDFDIN